MLVLTEVRRAYRISASTRQARGRKLSELPACAGSYQSSWKSVASCGRLNPPSGSRRLGRQVPGKSGLRASRRASRCFRGLWGGSPSDGSTASGRGLQGKKGQRAFGPRPGRVFRCCSATSPKRQAATASKIRRLRPDGIPSMSVNSRRAAHEVAVLSQGISHNHNAFGGC
jgi:hypothetical protein